MVKFASLPRMSRLAQIEISDGMSRPDRTLGSLSCTSTDLQINGLLIPPCAFPSRCLEIGHYVSGGGFKLYFDPTLQDLRWLFATPKASSDSISARHPLPDDLRMKRTLGTTPPRSLRTSDEAVDATKT